MTARIVTLILANMLTLPAMVQAARQLPVVNVAIVADGASECVTSVRTRIPYRRTTRQPTQANGSPVHLKPWDSGPTL
jgi:hypothetical protein